MSFGLDLHGFENKIDLEMSRQLLLLTVYNDLINKGIRLFGNANDIFVLGEVVLFSLQYFQPRSFELY